MAEARLKTQQYKSAFYLGRHALELNPRLRGVHTELAEIYRQSGHADWAATEEEAALKLAPGDPAIETQLAFALNQMGDYQAAQAILQPLVARHPESAMINCLLGDTYFKLQQPAQAIPYLEKAVARDPHLLTAQSSLARAYVQTGESAKAIPHLQAALPSDEDGSLHYQLARAYTANGQSQLGQQILKEYQEIQKAKAAEMEGVEKEVPITAPTN